MANKNNATCSICDGEYHLCLSCHDSMRLAPWKIHCDTAEHYKVFQIIRGFSTGVYTKEDAREKFQNVNLDDIETFRPHIKKIIKDILKENKPVAKVVKEIKPIETEIAKVEEVKEETAENVVEVEKPENIVKSTVTRKRNYKVGAE